jgi:hypothetical protein
MIEICSQYDLIFPEFNAPDFCSPGGPPPSYSANLNLFLNFFDFLPSSFVTPLFAGGAPLTFYFFFLWLAVLLATFFTLSTVPTEVPPHFNSPIFIGNIFYINFGCIDSVLLDYNVHAG